MRMAATTLPSQYRKTRRAPPAESCDVPGVCQPMQEPAAIYHRDWQALKQAIDEFRRRVGGAKRSSSLKASWRAAAVVAYADGKVVAEEPNA